MGEIEKMYENIGFIQKKRKDYSCIVCDKNKDCDKYSPFTAEKQIELIKWLMQKYKDISIQHQLNLFYINIRDIYTGMVHIEFDETIAGLINNLWLSLSEEEKQQVKGILE